MGRLHISVALTVCLVTVCSTQALADGCSFPEKAYTRMPAIPHQRAMILWRDGAETLIIESTYETESPAVAWVLPLPTEPSELRVADPNMLAALSVSQQPVVTHDLSQWVWLSIWLLAFCVGLCLIMVASPTWGAIASRGVVWLLFMLVGMWCLSGAGLTLSSSTDGAVSTGAMALGSQRVGNYDVTTLQAAAAGDLNAWLQAEGMRELDERARGIVDGYIARNWVFLVARLARDAAGEAATPHPIAATFPTAAPVYPMRLTALAGSNVRVELFVVADERAAAEGFRTVVSDRYMPFERGADGRFYFGTSFEAVHLRERIIGDPNVRAELWQGCVLTTLQADMGPEAMDRDVALTFAPSRPVEQHVFSGRGRSGLTSIIFAGGFAAVVLVAGFLHRFGRPPSARRLIPVGTIAAVVALSGAAVAAMLPVVDVSIPDYAFAQQMLIRWSPESLAETIAHGAALRAGMTPAQVEHALRRTIEEKVYVGTLLENPFTGETMHYARTPGNYALHEADGDIYFCVHDRYGVAYGVRLGRASPGGRDSP